MFDLEEINTYNAIQIEKTFIRNKRFQFFLEKKTTNAVYRLQMLFSKQITTSFEENAPLPSSPKPGPH